ncbi:MAG: hypothetical protein AABZ12_04785 [Planctomycetota bacterium]
MYRPIVLAGLFTAVVAGSGCDRRSGGATDVVLTEEQQAAVDAVVAQVEAAAKAVAGVAESFDGLDADSDLSGGTCPTVTAVRGDGATTVTVDFPEGCTNEYYGDAPVSGSVTLVLQLVSRAVSVAFNDFTTDEGTVAGTLALQLTGDASPRTLSGDVDITTSGVGSAVGTLEIQFDLVAGTITIVNGDLTLTDEASLSYSVDIDGLLMAPLENGNFIPQAGTITFEIPNSGPGPATTTIVITFDETSPENGTVAVAVGDQAAVSYTLP